MNFEHSMPECNLFFGENTLGEVGRLAKQWGDHILLVTGKRSMEKLGFLDEAIDSIKGEGLSYILYNQVEPNPSTDIIDQGVETTQKEGCNVILALGGGSAIDTAKAIAIGATHLPRSGGTIWEFSDVGDNEKPVREITSKTLPVIAATSTSGTGSHVTPWTVITNVKTHEKVGIGSKYVYPKASIVDLRVVSKMPPSVTAATGTDVLTHATESFLGKGNHPTADLFAIKALELVAQNLPQAHDDGSNKQARSNMAFADTLAGWAMTLADTIVGHGLAQPIGGHYDIAHGVALALITPSIWDFIIEHGDQVILDKFGYIGQTMGEKISLPATTGTAKLAVEALKRLLAKIDLDKKLSDYGIEKSKTEIIVKDALRYMAEDVELTPVKVSFSDLMKIMAECM